MEGMPAPACLHVRACPLCGRERERERVRGVCMRIRMNTRTLTRAHTPCSDDGPGALQEMLRTSAPRVRAVLRMLCERLARMSIDTHACSLRAVVGWLFAAAACVEKPLDADTAAALRAVFQ